MTEPQKTEAKPRIVLIGGGHAHALVLRTFAEAPLDGAEITLINPGPRAAYSGMLPGHIAGHYPREALEIDLRKLGKAAGATLIEARATGIDRAGGRVLLEGGENVPYDFAALDIGITSEMPALPGFVEHITPAKPLDAFADRWEHFVGHAPANASVAVIGGGVAGVELALACAHRLPQARVTVYEAQDTALTALGRGARARMLRHAARHGVTILTGKRLSAAEAGSLRFADDTTAAFDFAIGTGATRPAPWLTETGLDLHGGFVAVGPTLQSSDPAIFASGDIAHLSHAPRPKAGVFAVREAPVLAHNLRAAVEGGAMRTYHPQRDYLKLISTGDKRAVADKWGLPLDGRWLWRIKDQIDRSFMADLR